MYIEEVIVGPSPYGEGPVLLISYHLSSFWLDHEGGYKTTDQEHNTNDESNQAACGMVMFNEVPIDAKRDPNDANHGNYVRNNFHAKAYLFLIS